MFTLRKFNKSERLGFSKTYKKEVPYKCSHSCVPNATIIVNEFGVNIIAIEDIDEDTEITINKLVYSGNYDRDYEDLRLEHNVEKCTCRICVSCYNNPEFKKLYKFVYESFAYSTLDLSFDYSFLFNDFISKSKLFRIIDIDYPILFCNNYNISTLNSVISLYFCIIYKFSLDLHFLHINNIIKICIKYISDDEYNKLQYIVVKWGIYFSKVFGKDSIYYSYFDNIYTTLSIASNVQPSLSLEDEKLLESYNLNTISSESTLISEYSLT